MTIFISFIKSCHKKIVKRSSWPSYIDSFFSEYWSGLCYFQLINNSDRSTEGSITLIGKKGKRKFKVRSSENIYNRHPENHEKVEGRPVLDSEREFLISFFKLKASILEGLAVSCQKWDQQVNWSRFLKAQTSKRGPSSYYWTHAFSSRGCPFPFPFPFPFYSTHITPSFPPYHVHGRKTCMTYPFNSSISRIQMEVCEIFGWWRSQKNL